MPKARISKTPKAPPEPDELPVSPVITDQQLREREQIDPLKRKQNRASVRIPTATNAPNAIRIPTVN